MTFHTYVQHLCFRAQSLDEKAKDQEKLEAVRQPYLTRDNAGFGKFDNGKHVPDYAAQSAEYMDKAKKINFYAKVTFVVAVILFNIVFWSVAISEYVIPAENYLDQVVD